MQLAGLQPPRVSAGSGGRGRGAAPPAIAAAAGGRGGWPTATAAAARRAPRQPRAPVAAAAPAARGGSAFDSDDYWHEDDVPAPGGGDAASGSGRGRGARAATAAGPPSGGRVTAAAKGGRKAAAAKAAAAKAAAAKAAAEAEPGGGVVGVFVAGWMALISLLINVVLRPALSLVLLLAQPVTRMSPSQARHQLERMAAELPEGFWAKILVLWEQPMLKSIRITASVATWGVRLPAIAALLLTQGSVLASQVSLPVLAPLLLGAGLAMNSLRANAALIIPRMGLLVVLLWVLWFINSVIQTTWLVLRNQGRIDARTLAGARMVTECTTLLLAAVVVLSMLGLNVNALLLPTGVALAIACKDLLTNLIAGFYLVLVQPFRLGDKVAVSCSLPAQQPAAGDAPAGRGRRGPAPAGLAALAQGWFEGLVEKVDLRYTVIRDGRRRLMVPNTAFVTREFLVYDEAAATAAAAQEPAAGGPAAKAAAGRAPSPPLPPEGPSIREGHMATELPPLAQPIFPGMFVPHPGGVAGFAPPPQYGPLLGAFAPGPMHPSAAGEEQEEGGGGEDQDDQEGGAAAAAAQRGQPGNGAAAAGAGGGAPQEAGASASGGRPRRARAAAAKGPPGYLPQGYSAPGHYLSVPLWWGIPQGLPGVPWGPAPGAGQQQQPQQQLQQLQQLQQQSVQQVPQAYYDPHLYYEASAMHQPVPPPPLPQQQQQQQQQQGSAASAAPLPQSSAAHRQWPPRGGNGNGAGPQGSSQQQQQPPADATAWGLPATGQAADPRMHQQAMHVAALGGGGFGFWAAPPGALPPPYGHYMVPAYDEQQQQQQHQQHLAAAAQPAGPPAQGHHPLGASAAAAAQGPGVGAADLPLGAACELPGAVAANVPVSGLASAAAAVAGTAAASQLPGAGEAAEQLLFLEHAALLHDLGLDQGC